MRRDALVPLPLQVLLVKYANPPGPSEGEDENRAAFQARVGDVASDLAQLDHNVGLMIGEKVNLCYPFYETLLEFKRLSVPYIDRELVVRSLLDYADEVREALRRPEYAKDRERLLELAEQENLPSSEDLEAAFLPDLVEQDLRASTRHPV